MPVQDDQRPFLEEIRAITKDSEGRDVLRGLTYDETEWYLIYSDPRKPDTNDFEKMDADRDHYLELNEKHEAARHLILAVEHLAKGSNPTKH